MDERALELASTLVTPRYVDAGGEALRGTARVLRSVLAQRRCPEHGLPACAVAQVMHQLAQMDSNNFDNHVGAGEREGRVAVPVVAQRHYYMSHGIGRSGDLTSDQPKAAGSSLLAQVTNCMALDLVRLAGAGATRAAVVVPMATGMSLALTLRALAAQREAENMQDGATEEECDVRMRRLRYSAPRVVVWPRVDQKTALKCVDAAGLVPWPVEPRAARVQRGVRCDGEERHPYYVQVDVDDVARAIAAVGGRSNVLCVLSTTSCFAPRLPDDVVALSQLCARLNIAHVVNNAYGLQSRSIMNKLDAAQRLGRVDYFVQSTDKNFLVPVGGSVIASSDAAQVRRVSALYAGRASATPSMDVFLTLLSLGRRGFERLWRTRYECMRHLVTALHDFATARQETVVSESMNGPDMVSALQIAERGAGQQPPLPRNDISVAVTMAHYGSNEDAKALGARLFRSGVTGPRVVVPGEADACVTIAGCRFQSYGMHHNTPPCPMLIVACGVGMTQDEVTELMRRLAQLWPVRTVAVD